MTPGGSTEHQKLVKEWRPEDGKDDAPVQNVVYAHRAVLAARTPYFQNAFLGAAGFSEGATLQVQHPDASQADLDRANTMNSVPSQLYDGGLPSADEAVAMSSTQSNEIVKGSRVTFKESAHVLQRIVEFMYLGEIADLEEGKSTGTEDDYNLWMWLLTWSFKHKVFDLFQYILSHLMCMKLTPAFAARLLDLQIENSFSMSASVNSVEEARSGYNMMLDTLRDHAIDWFNTAPFDDDYVTRVFSELAIKGVWKTRIEKCPGMQIFLPLNRQALLVVLTECVFEVPEYKVVRAAKNWTRNSIWVQKAYSSAPMPQDQVHVIMQHTDPFCLTNLEFDEFSHPPETSIYNRWTYQMYWDIMAVHEGARYNSSEKCLDRSNLAEKFARKPPSDSASVGMSKKYESRSQQQTGQKAWMGISPYTGELAPTPPKKAAAPRPMDMDIDRRLNPPASVPMQAGASVLASVDGQARVDPNRSETAFVVGPNYYFKRDHGEFRYLVSLSVTTYQGLMYRGGLERGTLKWSLEIVRQCDMFWMGVTSKSGLDMSTMIARDPQVWMISEEGTCIEHCRPNAVTQAQPVRQRMNTLFIDCFKCINNPPTSWKKVIMELDSSRGDLYVTLNDRRRQHVFKNLPTHTRLFPCLMAVNTGQAHFELLEATMH